MVDPFVTELSVMPRHRPLVALAIRCALIAVVGLAATSCSIASGPGQSCTLIGCDDGLTVRFDAAPPPGPVRVELLPQGEGGPRYIVECPEATGCAAGVRFPGFTGDYAIVRVTTSRGTSSQEVRPTYVDSRPNGPDCPPVCRQGSVTVAMPA